jgi:diguanylate cyclase (GGDEF)-like protein
LIVVRDRISTPPIMVRGLAVRVTISAGVAVARTGEGFDQLYSAADHALYAAKSAGRNRVVLAEGTKDYRDELPPAAAAAQSAAA